MTSYVRTPLLPWVRAKSDQGCGGSNGKVAPNPARTGGTQLLTRLRNAVYSLGLVPPPGRRHTLEHFSSSPPQSVRTLKRSRLLRELGPW